MQRRSATERLRQLEQARKALEERIARARAQARSVERRRLARQRFVLGEALLPLLAKQSVEGEFLRRLLRQLPLSSADKQLLGLQDDDDEPLMTMVDDD